MKQLEGHNLKDANCATSPRPEVNSERIFAAFQTRCTHAQLYCDNSTNIPTMHGIGSQSSTHIPSATFSDTLLRHCGIRLSSFAECQRAGSICALCQASGASFDHTRRPFILFAKLTNLIALNEWLRVARQKRMSRQCAGMFVALSNGCHAFKRTHHHLSRGSRSLRRRQLSPPTRRRFEPTLNITCDRRGVALAAPPSLSPARSEKTQSART